MLATDLRDLERLGFAVCRRIGLEGSRSLAVVHATPVEYLRAAKLDPVPVPREEAAPAIPEERNGGGPAGAEESPAS